MSGFYKRTSRDRGSISLDLRTKFDAFPDAGASVVGGVPTVVGATGHQLPFSPKWQLFGGISYLLPLDIPASPASLRDIDRETSYFSNVFNYAQGRMPAQTYVDASLGYALPATVGRSR